MKPNIKRMKAKRDIDGLIKATVYNDLRVSRSAMIALGNMEAKESVIPIIRQLDAPILLENIDIVVCAFGRMSR